MTFNLGSKAELAEFVEDLLVFSSPNSPLTMTIIPVKSGGYSVTIVTAASLEDTAESLVASNFFATQVNT